MSSKSNGDLEHRLDEVIASYVRAMEAGTRPDREQLVREHPDLADDLRDFFRHRDRMEALLDPLRSAAARVLNVRCPHCRQSIELVDNAFVSDVNCPSCGSHFSLVSMGSTDRFPGGVKRIGHFQLIEHVGTGQFGSVWKARDLALERTVAIKIPRSHHLGQEEAEMFLRDARNAAQLSHPHIVGVHEVGRFEDTIYIVSDFIQGASLKQWMGAKRLDYRQIAELVITIAQALHHAHQAGVIHRDLKPGNIMMDLAGEPHIVDFGLAKRESGEITMTLDGQILGSPAYMPPEQARGEGHSADRRADIYSLGVVLYELLTDELPFRGDKQMLVVQILNDAPPPPRKLDSSVPRDLETICLKCLRKEPAHRYQTTAELAADLQRWLDHQPIAARPIGVHERVWSWCRRRPAVASWIALLLVVLIGSVLVTHESSQRETARRLVAELDAAEVSRLPGIVEQLKTNRRRAVPLLRAAEKATASSNSPGQRRASLALLQLTGDLEHAGPLLERMLLADPAEFTVLRDALVVRPEGLVEQLWEILSDGDEPAARRFRACAALATYAPSDERWTEVATFAAGQLVCVPPYDLAGWVTILEPVHTHLLTPLHEIFARPAAWTHKPTVASNSITTFRQEQQRGLAAYSLAIFARNNVTRLYELLMESEPDQFQAFMVKLAKMRPEFVTLLRKDLAKPITTAVLNSDPGAARRQTYAAIAAYQLGLPELATGVLRASAEPHVRTLFIHWALPYGVHPRALFAELAREPDSSVRSALVLTLGELASQEFTPQQWEDFRHPVAELYQQSEDPGLHSATEWLLRKWLDADQMTRLEKTTLLKNTRDARASSASDGQPLTWYVDAQDHTMVVMAADTFNMGVDDSIPPDLVVGRSTPRDRPRQPTCLGRTFAIATKEVTRRQWRRFEGERMHTQQVGAEQPDSPNEASPQNAVSWFDAAAYCNWLSEKNGIPPSEWAYVPNADGSYAAGMRTSARFPLGSGYRLPTDAEWEYACRGGTTTYRPFGIVDSLVGEYACCQSNSDYDVDPVGSHKPNDFGFFDMLGNVLEWCHDRDSYLSDAPMTYDIQEPDEVVTNRSYRLLRGGDFRVALERLDSADRTWLGANRHEYQVGFRVARTITPAAYDEPHLRWSEAMETGRRGKWRDAAEQMRQAIEAFPDVPTEMSRLCFIRHYLGETNQANSICEEIVERYGDTESTSLAHNVAHVALMFSQGRPSERVARLCEVSSRHASPLFARDTGMLYYRQGDFERAIAWLEKANDDYLYDVGQACTLYFLAMSFHQAADLAAADRVRKQADALYEKHRLASNKGDYGQYWYYWLGIDVLRAEVERTFRPSSEK